MTGGALDDDRLAELRELDPDGSGYLHRAIDNFDLNSARAVSDIRARLDDGDVASARAVAHKIAGSAFNLGALRAGQAGRALEVSLETAPEDDVSALVEELTRTMAEARSALQAYRGSLDATS